jgi:hypothetical protein
LIDSADSRFVQISVGAPVGATSVADDGRDDAAILAV